MINPNNQLAMLNSINIYNWQNFAACIVNHYNLVLLCCQMNQTCVGRRKKCMHNLYFSAHHMLTAFQFQSPRPLDDSTKEDYFKSDFAG